MDLAGIQNQLSGLGVTPAYDDDPPNARDQLAIQRPYRAALYMNRLVATKTFLTQTLADPTSPRYLGADYPFVAQALAGAGLLNNLAGSLDYWICPAVAKAINQAMARAANAPTTYEGWFDTDVFDPILVNYNNNVAAFFNNYPITDHALTKITTNFQDNLATACARILADRQAITDLFSDRYTGLTLDALTGITSTGSDFHKGGQQVLVLTFAVRSFGGCLPANSTLKLIYKPADLEFDCLLAGETAAVNRATGIQLMNQSLVEIFNAAGQAALGGPNPPAGWEPLPTYRILPRNPTKGLGPPPVPIRNAYGYIEYLGYSLTGEAWSAFNFYPLGASDYVIYRTQSLAPIIQRFYRQAGQLLALALTFSVGDLHVENVRVTAYQPRLIDLEVSLTEAFNNVSATLLLEGKLGGITGDKYGDDWVWTFVPRPNAHPPQVDLKGPQRDDNYKTRWYQNRLWAQRPDRRLVPVNAFWLLQGLRNGMDVLRAAQLAKEFDAWFDRVANVLVRVVPYQTSKWNQVVHDIYAYKVGDAPVPTPLQPALGDIVRAALTVQFNDYQLSPAPRSAPWFMALAAGQATLDLDNFDIPVFYHRVGTLDLLDSMGAVVPVPPQIAVNQGIPVAPTQVPTNVGRTTYFAAPPTTGVRTDQVETLTGDRFDAIFERWRDQALVKLELAAPPDNPGVLIPPANPGVLI